MRGLSKSVVEQVNENPHVVAGAITGLSRQLILSHHGYQDLTSKLSQYREQTDPKKLPRHHDEEMKVVIDRKRCITLVLLYCTSTIYIRVTTGVIHYGLYHHLHTVLRDHTLRDKSTGTLSIFD